MLTAEELWMLQNLLRMVVYNFFDDSCIVVLEGLLKSAPAKVREEELVRFLNLHTKRVHGALRKLEECHLVIKEVHANLSSRNTQSTKAVTYWFIDYKLAVESLTLRFHTMETNVPHVECNYVCRRCLEENKKNPARWKKAVFEEFDVMAIKDGCPNCGEEVLPNKPEGEVTLEDHMLQQLRPFREHLQQCQKKIVFPSAYYGTDGKQTTGDNIRVAQEVVEEEDTEQRVMVVTDQQQQNDTAQDGNEEAKVDIDEEQSQRWMLQIFGISAIANDDEEDDDEDEEDDAGGAKTNDYDNEPTMMIGGVSVRLSEITDDMEANMTADEYNTYFKLQNHDD